MDLGSGVTLILGTDPSSRDAEQLVVRVPDRGIYIVEAAMAMTVSATSISLSYEGAAILSPLVSLLDQTPRGVVTEPTDVMIRLVGQLDHVERTGTVTLEHDGVIITLVAEVADVGELLPVLDAFERATLAGDGALLYSVMNSDITAAYTEDAFARHLADQIAQVGSTTSMRRGAVSAPMPSEFGFWSVTVLYDSEVRTPDGVTTAHRYEAFFIRQGVGWKLWFTREL